MYCNVKHHVTIMLWLPDIHNAPTHLQKYEQECYYMFCELKVSSTLLSFHMTLNVLLNLVDDKVV